MNRGKAIISAAIVLICLLIYLTFPGGKKTEKREAGDYFCRTVKVIAPPSYAVQKGTGLRIERFLDRIQWGTSEAVNWTIECLKKDENRSFVPEVIRRIDSLKNSKPTQAKKYMDLLAVLKDPAVLPYLIESSHDGSTMLRLSALKGVSRFDTAQATECLLAQTRSQEPKIRMISLDNLCTRSAPVVTAFFEAILENPSDLKALSYAMKAVYNQGGDEALEKLRPFMHHEMYPVRIEALQYLLQLGDPAAMAQLEEELTHGKPVVRDNAIRSIAYLKSLPSREVLVSLAGHEDVNVRDNLLAALFLARDHLGEIDLATLMVILDKMSADPSPVIRMKAQKGLYLMGRTQVVTRYLKKVQDSYGGEFNEAVTFLTDMIKMQEAAPSLIERYENDPDLSTADRQSILEGLTRIQAVQALDLFFQVIRGGWNADTTPLGMFTMDQYAAFSVHNLGGDLLGHWLDFIEEDPSDFNIYLFLNGARYVEDVGVADALIRIADDPNRPLDLRREAILSFASIKDLRGGDWLLRFSQTTNNPELAVLASNVFWCFF